VQTSTIPETPEQAGALNIVPSGGGYAAPAPNIQASPYPGPDFSPSNITQNTIGHNTPPVTEQPKNTMPANVPIAVKVNQSIGVPYNSIQNGTAVLAAPRFVADANVSKADSSADRSADPGQKPVQASGDYTLMQIAIGIILASLAIAISYSVARRRLLKKGDGEKASGFRL
jgi:hypothetical protein